MKYLLLLFVLFISVYFAACENTEITDPEIIVDEYTVVRSELKANSTFKGVSFTKTLPVGISYDIKQAELKNVFTYLKIDHAQVIPLHYSSNGIYLPLYDLTIKPGKTFELFAKVGEKTIYSKTWIPNEPNAVSTKFNVTDYYYLLNLNSNENEVYGATWIISESPPIMSDNFFSIIGGTSNNELLSIRTQSIPLEYHGNEYLGRLLLKIYAFDKSYADYFKSRDLNSQVEDVYTQENGNISWNVIGDKTIGLFMGVAESNFIIPQ